MTATHPFSRPIAVDRLPQLGLETRIAATPEECAALAKDFKLPAIHALEAQFRVTGGRQRVHVTGVVKARISQTCVVSLDPFETQVEEPIEVDFSEEVTRPEGDVAIGEIDPPDEIVNGRIDLGALAAEFLALALDPYPRKPGLDFSFDEAGEGPGSPFAALSKLKDGR